jgi:hypothetical protein
MIVAVERLDIVSQLWLRRIGNDMSCELIPIIFLIIGISGLENVLAGFNDLGVRENGIQLFKDLFHWGYLT